MVRPLGSCKKVIPKICELDKCYETIPLRYTNGKAKRPSQYAVSRFCCDSHAAIARSIAQQAPRPVTKEAKVIPFEHGFKPGWWEQDPRDVFCMGSRL